MLSNLFRAMLVAILMIAVLGTTSSACAGDEIEIEIPGYGKIKIRKKEQQLIPMMPSPGEEPDLKFNCDDDDPKNDRWYWDTNGDGVFDWVWDPYRRQMWWLKPTPIQNQQLAMLLPFHKPWWENPEIRQAGPCLVLAVVPEPPMMATSGLLTPEGVPVIDGALLYEIYGVSEVPSRGDSVEFATDVRIDLATLTVSGWLPWNPEWSTAVPAYDGMEFVAEFIPASVGNDFVAINFQGDIFAMAGWAFDSGMAEFVIKDKTAGEITIVIDGSRRVLLNGVFVGMAAEATATRAVPVQP